MTKVINFFQYIFNFIKFIIELIYNIFDTVWSALTFVGNLFNALPLSIRVFLVGIVAVSIAYKLISLGGSGE